MKSLPFNGATDYQVIIDGLTALGETLSVGEFPGERVLIMRLDRHIDNLRTIIVYLEKEVKKLKRDKDALIVLLQVAVCPECDGSGGRQISENECAQCQWCFGRNLALNSTPKLRQP
jgi:hypothetical protein